MCIISQLYKVTVSVCILAGLVYIVLRFVYYSVNRNNKQLLCI